MSFINLGDVAVFGTWHLFYNICVLLTFDDVTTVTMGKCSSVGHLFWYICVLFYEGKTPPFTEGGF